MDVFIGQLLADVRTYIKSAGGFYDLTFHDDFAGAHRDLFPAERRRKASFRPDRRSDSHDVEFMVFGHPVVDAIVEQVLGENYEGVTGTRRIIAGEDLGPRAGWLFTYQFTTPGPRSTEDLVSVFVGDDGEVDADIGCRIVQRACRFEREEQEIDASDIPGNLHEMEHLARRFADGKREALQQQAESRAAEEVYRAVSRLQALFDYKERVARDKMEATRATMNRIRESRDELSRQILPVWEANFRRDEELPGKLAEDRSRRIAEVERYRYPQVSWALKSLGRIEVVKINP